MQARMHRLLQLWALALLGQAAALYEGEGHVLAISKAEFQEAVQGSNEPFLVHFYNESSAADDYLASVLAPIAQGLWESFGINTRALDCSQEDQVRWCKKENLRPFEPSLRGYFLMPQMNPYTKRLERQPLMIDTTSSGLQVDSKILKKVVLDEMPNFVKKLSTADGSVPPGTGVHVAVLSDRARTSPLLKALAIRFFHHNVTYWELHENDVGDFPEDIGITEEILAMPRPTVLGMVDGGDWQIFRGEPYRDGIEEFAMGLVAELGETSGAAGQDAGPNGQAKAKAKAKAKTHGEEYYQLDAAAYKKQVVEGQPAWVVVFVPAGMTPMEACADWSKLKTSVGGMLALGYVDCEKSEDLCAAKGVGADAAVIESWPFDRENKEDDGPTVHGADETKKAVDAAGESVPNLVEGVPGDDPDLIEMFITMTMKKKKLAMFVFSDKDQPPLFIKLFAEELSQYLMILFVSRPNDEISRRFGLMKLPTIICLMDPPENPNVDQYGRTEVAIAGYDPRQYGGFKFAGLRNFAVNLLAQRDREIAMEYIQQSEQRFNERHGRAEATDVKGTVTDENTSVLKELTDEESPEFAHCSGGRPCAMLLTDGAITEAQTALLSDILHKSGAVAHGAYVDGRCHPEFAASFDIPDASMLPALVVWSGKKDVFARYVGALKPEPAAQFVRSAVRGSMRFVSTVSKPEMGHVDDCEALAAPAYEEVVEEDGDLEDLMAEIRAEEEREAKKLQEEIAREAQEKKEREEAEKQAELERKAKEELKKKRKKKKKKKKKKAKTTDEL